MVEIGSGEPASRYHLLIRLILLIKSSQNLLRLPEGLAIVRQERLLLLARDRTMLGVDRRLVTNDLKVRENRLRSDGSGEGFSSESSALELVFVEAAVTEQILLG